MGSKSNQRTYMLGIVLVALAAATWVGAAPRTTSFLDKEDAYRAFLEWEVGVWDAKIMMLAADGTSVTYDGEQVDRLGACGLWLITDLRLLGEGAPPYEVLQNRRS